MRGAPQSSVCCCAACASSLAVNPSPPPPASYTLSGTPNGTGASSASRPMSSPCVRRVAHVLLRQVLHNRVDDMHEVLGIEARNVDVRRRLLHQLTHGCATGSTSRRWRSARVRRFGVTGVGCATHMRPSGRCRLNRGGDEEVGVDGGVVDLGGCGLGGTEEGEL